MRPDAVAVTNCDDSGPGSCRRAVHDAVSGGTIDLTNTGRDTITLTTGDVISAADDLTLRGPGADRLTISGGDAVQPLFHSGTDTLRIDGVTMSAGFEYLDADDLGVANGGCATSYGAPTASIRPRR